MHKSQHNCFLHPKENQAKQNKTNQTRKQTESSLSFIIITTGIFNLIINIVVHHHHRHHHRTGMPKPFCCGNGFCELYSKLILLWKWFPKSSISSSALSFIIITVIITVPECQNHFAVEMVSVSCTPNPFCCGNGFHNLQSHHQHRRSSSSPSSSPYRNVKTILLSKTIRCT